MKKLGKIIAGVAAIAAAFLVGRVTAPEATIPEVMEKAVENVEYWEVAEEGLDLYDYEGNVYCWR